jgi:hypothetical protein
MGLKYLRLAAKENHWQAKKQLAALLIRHQWHYDEAFGLLLSLMNNLVGQHTSIGHNNNKNKQCFLF